MHIPCPMDLNDSIAETITPHDWTNAERHLRRIVDGIIEKFHEHGRELVVGSYVGVTYYESDEPLSMPDDCDLIWLTSRLAESDWQLTKIADARNFYNTNSKNIFSVSLKVASVDP